MPRKLESLKKTVATAFRTLLKNDFLRKIHTDEGLPVIPESVEDAYSIFEGCTSLSGTIVINANPTRYGESFQNVDMSKITLAGSCSSAIKQRMANTGENGSQVTIID